MRDESPQYRSAEPTLQSTMYTRSNHNMMSATDHDWIMGLMQHRMRRGSSTREKIQLVAPVSPSSERVDLKKQTSVRARLMSDNRIRELETSPRQQGKMKVRKPALDRRFTVSTCDSNPVPHFDIPFEIRVRIPNDDEREACDDISEVSVEDDFYQGQSGCIEDGPISSSTGSVVGECRVQSNATPGIEQGWGMTTLCLDDHHDVWPSDEGSPMKMNQRGNNEGAPVHMLALDDEREDFATQQSSTKALFGEETAVEDRHEQTFIF